MKVESFKIESEAETDEYLTDLLKNPEHQTISELELRAEKYITDENLRKYFLNRGSEILSRQIS